MSKRRHVVLIGLLALGQSAALATAPQIVDPRDDMVESTSRFDTPRASEMMQPRPEQGTPATSKPAAAAAAKPDPAKAAAPAASGRAAELPANPLWAIPLSQLTAMRDRPPFSPSRRPPPPVVVARPAPQVAAPPPPKPPEAVTPQLSLVGTIVGAGAGIGLFVNAADKSTIRLKLGDNHKGWVLRAVASHQVELANGLDSAVLKLPPPDMKPSAAAPPPAYAAAAPQVPQGAPQGMPMPSSPVNAARPPNGASSANTPDGQHAAAIAIRPPVFDPPQPAVNPFHSPVKEKGAAR